VHLPEHVHTWKTALPCEARADAVVEELRSSRPVQLVPAPATAALRMERARAS